LDDSLPHSSYASFWSMNDYAFMQKEVHLGNCLILRYKGNG
jgi:hypothetical protein